MIHPHFFLYLKTENVLIVEFVNFVHKNECVNEIKIIVHTETFIFIKL